MHHTQAHRSSFQAACAPRQATPGFDPALLHLADGDTTGAVVLEGVELTSVLAIAPYRPRRP